MHLTSAQVRDMTAETLREFLELAIPEGRHIDYKLRLSGDAPEAQKLEFLKDISAFANSDGGDLIIGALEPAEGRQVAVQLRGIERGDEVAHRMERAASSSIDPRIAGLQIRPIALGDDRFAILVHIPPSMVRPHMVTSVGNRGFYIRHTESSQSMSTHEIREAVLSSATVEARAREYMDRREREAREYGPADGHHPWFMLQAMPLIAPDQPWDMSSDALRSILLVGAVGEFHKIPFFDSDRAPRPTIDGIMAQHTIGSNPASVTEIHRNGYISAYVSVIPSTDAISVDDRYSDIFSAFSIFVQNILHAMDTNLPYVIRCKLIHANGLIFHGSKYTGVAVEPYRKDEICWPDYVRNPGESISEIVGEMRELFHNAFGLHAPPLADRQD